MLEGEAKDEAIKAREKLVDELLNCAIEYDPFRFEREEFRGLIRRQRSV